MGGVPRARLRPAQGRNGAAGGGRSAQRLSAGPSGEARLCLCQRGPARSGRVSAVRAFNTTLPIDVALPKLTAALRTNAAAVVVAPPGAGKTTRVPPLLGGEPWAVNR